MRPAALGPRASITGALVAAAPLYLSAVVLPALAVDMVTLLLALIAVGAALGLIAFCAPMAEGSVFDWSGVYLADETGAAAGAAPLGLTAFS